MTDLIHVQPAPEQRVAFARWAVAQTPKVRTVASDTFAVPAAAFTDAPEGILIGARVDGRRYVSPDEEEGGQGAELLGVATAEGLTGPAGEERTAVPGEPLPEADPSAYGPESVPLDAPDDQPEEAEEAEEFPCEVCGRPFSSERGRTMHVRRAHPEA